MQFPIANGINVCKCKKDDNILQNSEINFYLYGVLGTFPYLSSSVFSLSKVFYFR